MTLRQTIKNTLFRLLRKDPEPVVVTFLTGSSDASAAMADEVRRLLPGHRHSRVGLQGADADLILKGGTTGQLHHQLRARLSRYRIGMAAVLFDGRKQFDQLRRAAVWLAPRKILAYNDRLERHHLQLRSLISSILFLRGVPLDRIHLRPRWLSPWKSDVSVYPSHYQILEGRAPGGHRRRLAVLTPYLPWPLAHGGAVRMYHLLREAACHFDIFLFAFRDQESAEDCATLLDLCARIVLVDKPRYREPRWSTLLPPEVHEFDSPVMRRLWKAMATEFDLRLRQVESTFLAGYDGEILVEHDVTFDLYSQIHERTARVSSWWDLFRWRRFERRAVRRFPRVVVMSEKDARMIPRAKTVVIGNGVDLERFTPEPEHPGRRLLFIGSFRHFPNILAYRFFTEHVWPMLWPLCPEMTVTVVGGPDPLLYWREHTGMPAPPDDDRIQLLGFVADVRPLYVDATLVVVPTTVSAGTNLKVLEAMAMGRAVVSTPSGCAGLGLRHGESVWVAEDPRAFVEGVIRLLEDGELRARMAALARRHAEAHFSWGALGKLQGRLYAELLARPLTIRPATRDDLPSLARIQAESAEASHWSPERYLAYTCHVAEREREVVGFLVSRETAPGEREILNLAVSMVHRRIGVASALLRYEIQGNRTDFFLEVRESNLGAQELYRGIGFEVVGKRPGYYDTPPEAAVVMKLKSC